MADLFIRPYDQQRRSPARFIVTALVVLAAAIALVGFWIWLDNRSGRQPDSELVYNVPPAEPVSAVPQTNPASKPVSSSSSAAAPAGPDTRQLFARAQSLAASGSLEQSRKLLDQVIRTTTDVNLKNNALRVLGRVNMQLFLSPVPSPEKKSYIIQPGDSLDRIARQNKTTIDLIRKMNDIEGTLIYPGRRLLLPAEPFVIHVRKSTCTLDLMMQGKLIKRYIVGLGVGGKTPVGNFKTVVHQMNPDWTPPGGGIIPFGDPKNVLGTRWMSIQDAAHPEVQGFGIHGTPQRESIGAETSNGCVRMLNEEVEELYMLIPRGTDVVISE
ncbi:MAG: L,D-transpeptidase family protein [Pontiellaceae bacterium]|jgi:lipoprotein-anchoring transpeptidase ErfK/SrfK|nr:L,D-transpeptidase family protein [Pontiellaceae bacterium]